MSVNNSNLALSYEQAASLMNTVIKQATGVNVAAEIAAYNFVSVASTALRSGYDPLLTSISNTVGVSLFAVRPYTGVLGVLGASEEKYGGITRKVNYLDSDLVDDERLKLTDGQTGGNPYEVRKPKVIQTNFYGGDQWSDFVTVYTDQIDMALTSVNEFNRFITGVISNLNDRREVAKEAARRTVLLNGIGAVMGGHGGAMSKVNLLAEYNTYTGGSLSIADIRQPDVFPDFAKWAIGRMATYLDMMAQRNIEFHFNPTAGNIPRHTPADKRKAVFSSDWVKMLNSRVKSSIYNPEFLNIPEHSEVSFWQSIKSPDAITIDYAYMANNGDYAHAKYNTATGGDVILGVVFDDDAMGQAMMSNKEWQSFNPRGQYSNIGNMARNRYWLDTTENMIVFYLANTTT